jgi:MFS family permease
MATATPTLDSPEAATGTTPARPPSPWRPLANRVFRWLWIASVASNIGTWLQSVGASWLMATLSSSASQVALVQAATSLPMFLLSLPSGALADVLDRRKVLLFTQLWMTLAAAALGLFTLAGRTTPGMLLFFTFVLGLGAAMNGPAWQAITPELVPREDLPAAVTLASVGFNIARAAGPAIGGLIIAASGAGVTFLLNAVSFLGVLVVLYRWKRPEEETMLPAERIWGAMQTGVRYVLHAPEVMTVILRGTAFVLCGSSLWALLPLIAKRELAGGPTGYGLLLGALGIGAVSGAMVLPRLSRNRENSTDLVVAVATLVFAAATVTLAYVRSFPLLLLAMLFAGGAWLSLLSSLNVAVQTLVPSWVRARALSVYMLVFYGGLAGGSALWGAVGDRYSVSTSLLVSAVGMVVGLALTARYHLRSGEGLNLAPSRLWPAPIVRHEPEPERGPVLVSVHYQVEVTRQGEFKDAMRAVRRIRLRDGAMEWGLFADAAVEHRMVEVFLVKSWLEYLRQRERMTVADRDLADRARAFHVGDDPPAVHRLIAERVPKRD